MPLVSVVVPVYKVEQYLQDCIDSIKKQTYQNLEIILVDDGSPDLCGEICEKNASIDKRIKVIHKENGGLSDARNAGIEIATGDYITFVDSDDFLFPTMIEQLVNLAERKKADFISCRHTRCDSNDKLENFTLHNQATAVIYTYESDDKMLNYLKNDDIDTVAWGKLYSINLFNQVRYPVGKYHEDVFTTYKLVHKAKKIVTTNFIGYVYRVNAASITGASFNRKRFDAIDGKIRQAKFLKQYYPALLNFGYAEIIYACNRCFYDMSKSSYRDKEDLKKLQSLYRKYWKFYVRGDYSKKGKALAILSTLNIHLAKMMIQIA